MGATENRWEVQQAGHIMGRGRRPIKQLSEAGKLGLAARPVVCFDSCNSVHPGFTLHCYPQESRMAIHELNDEQIRTWSLEQKDRWWLEKVFRGDMPQLTLRAGLMGMGLGSVLSLTNIYVGAKTGWSLGVGITSVILAFAFFRTLSKMGLAHEFTILENNAVQSIATAAGYMTSPLISSLAAYMMVTGYVIPMWQLMSWVIVLAILGVLFAFPFKRRFINDEQQPFPEGRAAGVVMDSLHSEDAAAGLLKAKLLVVFGGVAALVKLLQSESITEHFMTIKGFTLRLPEFLDEWLYKLTGTPSILGTPVTSLTLRPELDLPMMGAGGLMGIRTGVSIMIGATINYAILAPIMIYYHDIVPDPKTGALGFRQITFWSLWCGVAMMTIASLFWLSSASRRPSWHAEENDDRVPCRGSRIRRLEAHRAAA